VCDLAEVASLHYSQRQLGTKRHTPLGSFGANLLSAQINFHVRPVRSGAAGGDYQHRGKRKLKRADWLNGTGVSSGDEIFHAAPIRTL
jgi:hypothetical protein